MTPNKIRRYAMAHAMVATDETPIWVELLDSKYWTVRLFALQKLDSKSRWEKATDDEESVLRAAAYEQLNTKKYWKKCLCDSYSFNREIASEVLEMLQGMPVLNSLEQRITKLEEKIL